MKSEGWKGERGGSFTFYKKERWLFVGDLWKENNFSFSRMNIYFVFLVIRLEIWDGMGGTAENAEVLLFIGEVSFSFWLNASDI